MSGLARWIGIAAVIGVIAVVGFIFRDRLSGNAGELQVGDCFDDPGAVAEVSDVQHHPCTEPHTGEVFYVGEMTGDNSSYPADDAFLEHVGTNCVPAFETYTGTDVRRRDPRHRLLPPDERRLGRWRPRGDLLRLQHRRIDVDGHGQGRGAMTRGRAG